MAFVVLFTTMSFTIDMHFCGDTLIDYAIFKSPKTCGMEQTQVAEKECQSPVFSQESCCSDEQLVVEGQDDLKNAFESLSFEQQVFVAAFTQSYSTIFEGTHSQEVPVIGYSPPLVQQYTQVLHQTFLI